MPARTKKKIDKLIVELHAENEKLKAEIESLRSNEVPIEQAIATTLSDLGPAEFAIVTAILLARHRS